MANKIDLTGLVLRADDETIAAFKEEFAKVLPRDMREGHGRLARGHLMLRSATPCRREFRATWSRTL
jgi:hypothetical protein